MDNILNIPNDRRQSQPLRLVVMMGLTLLLYLVISTHVASDAAALAGLAG